MDLFPQELCDNLALMHCNVQTHSIKYTYKALEESFGPGWRDALVVGDVVGSGCVAQVHKGLLLPSGRDVASRTKAANDTESAAVAQRIAIKVIHLKLLRRVSQDIELLRLITQTMEKLLPFVRPLSMSYAVEQFALNMTMQLDLRGEAANLIRFTKDFENSRARTLLQPRLPFVSKTVLVESFSTGRRWKLSSRQKDAWRWCVRIAVRKRNQKRAPRTMLCSSPRTRKISTPGSSGTSACVGAMRNSRSGFVPTRRQERGLRRRMRKSRQPLKRARASSPSGKTTAVPPKPIAWQGPS